jgi:putative transposase
VTRPLRLEFEGAVYHVTSRGNERSTIFRDDSDRRRFLEFLGRVVTRERWALHAHCLMGNHYHLLLETPLGNLSRGMQRLNGRYTQYFNVRHRRAGHLLQGRFKAILVERDAHLVELTRYVVLNPVRARIVPAAERWPWSNYRATAGLATKPDWLEVDWTLSQLSSRRSRARKIYRQFVSEGKGLPSPWKDLRNQIYLGGESFLKEIGVRLQGHATNDEVALVQRRPWVADVGVIKRAVAAEYGLPVEALGRRRGGEDKLAAIYLMRKLTNLTLAEIGKELNVKAPWVGQAASRIEREASRALRQRLDRIEVRVQK